MTEPLAFDTPEFHRLNAQRIDHIRQENGSALSADKSKELNELQDRIFASLARVYEVYEAYAAGCRARGAI